MKNYIKILFPHYEFGELNYESAWATAEGIYYKLDNILFYAKEYSLGDVFSVKKIDDEYIVDELIKESGHSNVRLLFSDISIVENTRMELKKIGCDSELSNINNLISIDIPPSVNYVKKIKPFLEKGENSTLWEYQEACISEIHH